MVRRIWEKCMEETRKDCMQMTLRKRKSSLSVKILKENPGRWEHWVKRKRLKGTQVAVVEKLCFYDDKVKSKGEHLLESCWWREKEARWGNPEYHKIKENQKNWRQYDSFFVAPHQNPNCKEIALHDSDRRGCSWSKDHVNQLILSTLSKKWINELIIYMKWL